MEPLYTESELRAAIAALVIKSDNLLFELESVREEMQVLLKRLEMVVRKPEGVILPPE